MKSRRIRWGKEQGAEWSEREGWKSNLCGSENRVMNTGGGWGRIADLRWCFVVVLDDTENARWVIWKDGTNERDKTVHIR